LGHAVGRAVGVDPAGARSVKLCVVPVANAEGQQKVNKPAPEDAKMLDLIWLD
jgi:hypothetical protein